MTEPADRTVRVADGLRTGAERLSAWFPVGEVVVSATSKRPTDPSPKPGLGVCLPYHGARRGTATLCLASSDLTRLAQRLPAGAEIESAATEIANILLNAAIGALPTPGSEALSFLPPVLERAPGPEPDPASVAWVLSFRLTAGPLHDALVTVVELKQQDD